MAPLLISAEKAGLEGMKKRRYPGNFSSSDFFDDVNLLKSRFASLVHADHADEIAIIPAASYGMANAISNVCPKKGGHALIIDQEFPSGRLALERWCEDHLQEIKVIRPGDDPLDGRTGNQKILEAISNESSVLVMSSVHWMNGIKYDMKAIGQRCAETQTMFIVDGTQSVGAVSMNVKEFKIDALICAGYKWLMGPYSVSMAYFGEKFNHGRPIEESWRNRTNALAFGDLTNYGKIYAPLSSRYEVGEASNFILIPMMNEGIRQVAEWGPERIADHCRSLMKPVYEVLESNGQSIDSDYQSAHIQGIRPPQGMSVEDFSQRLTESNVRTSIRGSYVRMSSHFFNDNRDIQALLECMH